MRNLPPNRVRIISNYARLMVTFVLGLVLVRLLLQFGDAAYGLIALLGAGTGIAALLKEVVRASLIPELGRSHHEPAPNRFLETYHAALLLCLGAATLTLFGFYALGIGLAGMHIPPTLLGAARWFLVAKAVQSFFAIALAPTFNMYLVTERMAAYNGWIVVERAVDILSAGIVLSVGSYADPKTLILWYGGLSSGLAVLAMMTSSAMIIALDKRLLPRPQRLSRKAMHALLHSAGWNSLVVLAMNLYTRMDMVIMNLVFGLFGNLVFGIASQLTAYVRLLTMGLVTGIDAMSARLSSHAGRDAVQRLMNQSTRLQGMVVFPSSLALLVLAEPTIRFWVGSKLSDPETSLGVIASITRILVLGMAARSLSEGWMRVLSGSGQVRKYAPSVLLAAATNPVLALLLIGLLPDSYRMHAPAWAFSLLLVLVHLLILPGIVARHFETTWFAIVRPLIRPLLATALVAPWMLSFATYSDWTLVQWVSVLAVYGVAYGAACFVVVLEAAERREIMEMVVHRLFRIGFVGRIIPSVFAEVVARAAHGLVGCFSSGNGFAVERRIRGMFWAAKLGGGRLQLDRHVQIECPGNVRLGDRVTLYGGSHYVAGRRGHIEIGDGTHIGRQCVLSGLGGIRIGKGCAIASSVNIYSVTNQYRQDPTAPILENDSITARVAIGDDVWIGAGATILPGVSVGDHAVIGAGAVVTRDIAPWMIVAGVPARVLKDRREEGVLGSESFRQETNIRVPRVA